MTRFNQNNKIAILFLSMLVYILPPITKGEASEKQSVNVGGVVFSMVEIESPENCIQVEIQPRFHEHSSKKVCSGYWIGETEVTQKLYEIVMGTNPNSGTSAHNHPISKVNLWDAQTFLKKLSKHTGISFRLPTKAEWVHACRATASVAPQSSVGWVSSNSERKAHPIKTSDRNAIGIYDMLGNVAEWVSPDKPLQPGDIYYWVFGYHYNEIAFSGDAICSQAFQRYSFNRTPIIGIRLATDARPVSP